MWSEKNRIRLVNLLLVIFVILIFTKLVYLQIIKKDFYENISQNQSSKEFTITQNRALITDRKGNVIAKNRKVASIYVFSKQIEDFRSFITDLKKSGLDISDKAYSRLKAKEGFVWLSRNADFGVADYLSKKYKYVGYIIDEGRYYSYKNLFSQIVGFTGVDNQGLYGVEKIYDNELKGDELSFIALRDSTGKLIMFHDKEGIISEEKRLALTLDKDMQQVAELAILDGIEEFGADKGIVIGMDVSNGEILFAVSYPGFDPNRYGSYSKDLWKNYTSYYLFEPGSIMKPFTFTYLLDNNMLDLNENIFCENGKYAVHTHVIKDVHPYGNLNSSEVLVKSSNIGTVKLNSRIPPEDFYNYLKKLGFGEPTSSIGSGEESGLLRNVKKWSKLSQPSLSIGQELLVTPIQIVKLYAAIANGGYLHRPKFVKIQDSPTDHTKVFTDKSINLVKSLLREVVERGTATTAKSDYVTIAGKTGTAQKFDKNLGKYSTSEYVASFAGFFPFENPKIAMVVIYENPKKSIYGGTTAAVTFKRIAEEISVLLGHKIKSLRVVNVS
ncbi:MAG: penicillin-binding protein 2 [Calditerrivibrio sp.]|nr:penicillin-binding protein 2 [Calditerrivibrio sp.]